MNNKKSCTTKTATSLLTNAPRNNSRVTAVVYLFPQNRVKTLSGWESQGTYHIKQKKTSSCIAANLLGIVKKSCVFVCHQARERDYTNVHGTNEHKYSGILLTISSDNRLVGTAITSHTNNMHTALRGRFTGLDERNPDQRYPHRAPRHSLLEIERCFVRVRRDSQYRGAHLAGNANEHTRASPHSTHTLNTHRRHTHTPMKYGIGRQINPTLRAETSLPRPATQHSPPPPLGTQDPPREARAEQVPRTSFSSRNDAVART